MLHPDDQAALGIAATRLNARKPPRASAVSRALRAIREELEVASAARLPVAEGGAPAEFRVAVANTKALRQRAYALAYEVYRESGYAKDGGEKRLVAQHDADPETLTLLAEDAHGRAAGTMTLYFDGPRGLPCDAIFRDEIDALRDGGRRPVEVGRLAIAPEHRQAQLLLRRLINLIFIYAKRVKDFTDFVIEVNPRHVAFYRRFLKFEEFGAERPCPRVEGAPAVLLRLDLDFYAKTLAAREAGTLSPDLARTLYAKFLPLAEEPRAAAFLARQQRAMSRSEARAFGLAAPPASAASRTDTPLELELLAPVES
ncbi:MAG: hypothetical protein L6R28_00930 [Planctomycetes bacterium]|nr:hypothetical protein [Planctomycetota bacterium]